MPQYVLYRGRNDSSYGFSTAQGGQRSGNGGAEQDAKPEVILREFKNDQEFDTECRKLGFTSGEPLQKFSLPPRKGLVFREPIDGVASASVAHPRRFYFDHQALSYIGARIPRATDETKISLEGGKSDPKGNGRGIRVAVLDTGVCKNHVAFQDLVWAKDKNNKELIHSFVENGTPLSTEDKDGHGTHVLSIAYSVASQAEYMAGKVLDDNGDGSNLWIARGIQWAQENGAHVINLSLGSAYHSRVIADAINDAIKAGIVVVCAAGNDGNEPGTIASPGSLPSVVTVGACNYDWSTASFSGAGSLEDQKRNPKPDLVAPGVGITGAHPIGRARYDGTSQATPLVSGACALTLAARPPQIASDSKDKTAATVVLKRRLIDSCCRIPNHSPLQQGKGILNVINLLEERTLFTEPPWHWPAKESENLEEEHAGVRVQSKMNSSGSSWGQWVFAAACVGLIVLSQLRR